MNPDFLNKDEYKEMKENDAMKMAMAMANVENGSVSKGGSGNRCCNGLGNGFGNGFDNGVGNGSILFFFLLILFNRSNECGCGYKK
ncbi:hypothetical protein LGL08_23390 [Clostridium estertheticum]|uniref:hypothetical protein n=1 Tax=Clostridium estertheticum TaxID=238834 RepID=UPI001CF43C9D|nr:hypothetical protein [Clostridium estertheticum]MCB2309485.1 hypothetical protein [Clostridium estertheticum]MCB2347945.1 hypothetical protein [Clostridium estertheticum]MCB2352437.1 hypothetical protein [Clostridium estertheticum]WAG48313.1 hypothetical protein LL127_22695 [Clostridium estertheticum]WAG48363.1 hypothetical protein LL127_22420 [Clostridium estertheticum]